ncbi:MAG: potassium-transporting ATPase subunit KdpA [Alphaproteobacteria bacterium]
MLAILIFFILITITSPYIGKYISYIYSENPNPLQPKENKIIKWCLNDDFKEQTWVNYTKSLIFFNILGFCFLFLILIFQNSLPLNFHNLPNLSIDQAFNISASYVTNTNWQSLNPEHNLSNFTQIVGLGVQNFLAPATSISLAIALIRGITRENSNYIGNFYQDMFSAIIYILIPLSIISGMILISQGVPQNFSNDIIVNTIEDVQQIFPQGPIASQTAISLIGNNGGGFFNSGFSHPYQNPTPFTNMIEIFLVLLLPSSFIFAYAKLINNSKHGWTLYITFSVILLISTFIMYNFEKQMVPWNDIKANLINFEGKELKNKLIESVLWTSVNTATSSGALNSDLDSYTPLAIMMAFINLMLGGVIFGSVGTGICNIIIYMVIALFLSGLMIGKTPEFLGKKLGTKEISFSMIILLVLPVLSLVLSSITILVVSDNLSINKGPHYLTQIIYTFVSTLSNNGSSMKGLETNIEYFNIILGLCMLAGRFIPIILILMLSGIMLKKRRVQSSICNVPEHGIQFGVIISLTIALIGGLTFFPILCVGPILEHLILNSNNLF